MKNLLLASSSKPRQEILARLQIPFSSFSPNIDESQLANETAYDLVKRLSIEKAKEGAKHYPEHLCIGGDQIALIANTDEILGKPHTYENAVQQLERCSKKTIFFLAGICLYNPTNQNCHIDIVSTEVVFRDLTREEIDVYLSIDKPYHCAGSFKSESLGISLSSKMLSSDPTAIVGLPLISLRRFLVKENFNFKMQT